MTIATDLPAVAESTEPRITLWGRRSSSNVQAVLWCLEELCLPYRRIDAGFIYGINDTADYLAMNPNGTVPTLKVDDGPPLWESAAIMRYLCNQHAPDSFWPADPVRRAIVDMWAEWAKLNVAMNFTSPVFWPAVRIPEPRRNPRAIHQAVRHLEHYLAIADERLSAQVYLAGEDLTLADIQFGHVLFRYYDIDIERTDFQHLKRYYQHLAARESYRQTVIYPYDELRDSL